LHISRARRPVVVIVALIATFAFAHVAATQDAPVPDSTEELRALMTPATPAPEDGHYLAGENIEFWIDHQDENVRLRFADNEEIFYLGSEPSSLGGRVLKYDTGDVALAVSGWGGVTLYTNEVPGGIPAERMGEAPNLDPRPVPARETQTFAANLARELATGESLAVGFAADWDRISRGNRTRALAIDSMRNATYALAELAETPESKSANADRIKIIRIIPSDKSGVSVVNGTVTVTFDANGEPSERPSSRAILKAIEDTP
jgi:hypothetical protein